MTVAACLLVGIVIVGTILILVYGARNKPKEGITLDDLEVLKPSFEELLNKIQLGEHIPGDDGAIDPDSVIAVYSPNSSGIRITEKVPFGYELYGEGPQARMLRDLYFRPETWYPYYQLNPSFVHWPPHLFSKFYYWGPAITSGMTWAVRPGAVLGSRPPRAGWVRNNGKYYFLNNSGFD